MKADSMGRLQLKCDGTRWRMGWEVKGKLTNGVGSQYLPGNMVYPALLPLMRTPRLPVVDWTDAPADLNGLARYAERRNLVSAHVPSYFNWGLQKHAQSPNFMLSFSVKHARARTHKHTHIHLSAHLTLDLLTWKIWWAPNNAGRWQMGFNSAFKGLNQLLPNFWPFPYATCRHNTGHRYGDPWVTKIEWEVTTTSGVYSPEASLFINIISECIDASAPYEMI